MSAEILIVWSRGRGDDVRCIADTKTPAVISLHRPTVYLVISFLGQTLMARENIVTPAELSMSALLGTLALNGNWISNSMQRPLPSRWTLGDL